MEWWKDLKLRTSAITLVSMMVVLICSNVMFWTNIRDLWMSIVLMVFGGCLGWLTGVLASPYTDREAHQFSSMARAVGTFASGYLVAKVDRLSSNLLNPDFLLNAEVGLRVMTMISSMSIFFLMTFIFRNYAPNTRLANNRTDQP